jgi:hypothetical protein
MWNEKKMLRLALILVGCALTILVVYHAGTTRSATGNLTSVQSSSQMWPLCRANGATDPLHVVVDDENYYVPPRDIWTMSKCAEGRVSWFTVRDVTNYRVLLSIGSRAERWRPKFDRARAFAQMHASDPLTPEGLLRDPTFDSEQFSNYLGHADDGAMLTFACTDKKARPQQHYCTVLKETNSGPTIEYSFDLSILSEWKAIDRAVRSYVLQIREPLAST